MPQIDKVEVETLTRDWGEEIIFAKTPQYLGKLLAMKAGTRGGLQTHVEKDETFLLLSGKALVETDNGDGRLTCIAMNERESYHIPPGAVHRVHAVTDCLFVEASTPHFNDRVRMEERYGLKVEGGLPTTR